MGEAKKKRDAGIGPAGPKPAEAVKNWNYDAALAALKAVQRPDPATTPTNPPRQQVVNFCRSISEENPVYLPLTIIGEAYKARWCHNNVLEQVRRAGGRRVFGWMIWDSGSYAEAEFHSVWETPDGELVDLTPRIDGEVEILFLPDPVTKIVAGDGFDLFPNNRLNVAGCPYTHAGKPHSHPLTRRLYDARSPFGFKSVA